MVSAFMVPAFLISTKSGVGKANSLHTFFVSHLFIETLLANPDRSYEVLMSDVILNDFGFVLQQDLNKKEGKSTYRKDKNGNYVVGKISSLELAKKIKSGNSIVKINDEKFILDEKQIEILLKDGKIITAPTIIALQWFYFNYIIS